jgi:Uma2 family endonuclease
MVVICDEGHRHPRDPDGGGVNPRLIAEVTSPNTEKRDRGVKLDDYRFILSLSEYLIVSHVRHEIEIWTRGDADGPWLRRVVTAGQAVELGLGVALNADDLYRDPLPPR